MPATKRALPAGWEELTDAKGLRYFRHTTHNVSTYDHPSALTIVERRSNSNYNNKGSQHRDRRCTSSSREIKESAVGISGEKEGAVRISGGDDERRGEPLQPEGFDKATSTTRC